METLVDLVARSRRSDAPAVRAPATDQFFDYDRFCTSAWKTANFLRARGVRERSTVGIDGSACGEPLLAFFGATLLGAKAYVGAPADVDARAVVADVDAVDEYDLDAGTQRIAFGGDPDAADVYYFERDVWSENPTMPPEAESRMPVNVALVTGVEALTHGDLLGVADELVDRLSLTADTEVAVRAPLADPRVLAGGVLAPLSVGGTVVFPDDDTTADAAICAPGTDAPEDRTLDVHSLEF